MHQRPTSPAVCRLRRPARRRAGLATAAVVSAISGFGALSACATPPSATGSGAPTSAVAASAGCDRPAGGGAAPPRIASAELREVVAGIVQRLQATPLTPDSAGRLHTALCDAGLWQHPGIDSALAPSGLSRKQITALAPAPPPAPGAAPASGPRRIPPRE